MEANTAFYTGTERATVNDGVSLSELLVLSGTLEKKTVRVLKDEGCNTNFMSYEFFKKNKKLLKWKSCNVEVGHSRSGSSEISSAVVLEATWKIRAHN